MPTEENGGKVERPEARQELPQKVSLRTGNLFESGAHTIVITVNCVGVMGKGIALEAKERNPELFKKYSEMCKAKQMRLGQPVFVPSLLPPSYLLFPTKDHWRSVSKLEDIEAGLRYLAEHHSDWKIDSLAVPPLGCGLGGLEWAVVGPSLYKGLAALDIPVFLYVPSGVAADAAQLGSLRSLATEVDVAKATRTSPPEVVAILLALQRVLQLRPQKEVGRVLIQKLGYFALVAGIPAPIRYVRKSYGPYSADWMSQIRHLVNNGLLIEDRADGDEAFAYRPGPSLESYSQQLGADLDRFRPAVERLARLIAPFNPDQAEFAATVHMVAIEQLGARRCPLDEAAVVQVVQDWKRRRGKPFPEERIKACIHWLRERGWLPGKMDTASDRPADPEGT